MLLLESMQTSFPGFGEFIKTVIATSAAVRSPRRPRMTKVDIKALNLELPLIQTVWDATYEYVSSPAQAKPPVDLHAIPDSFGLLKVEDICKLASGLLHSQLHLLLHVRGNADNKREALEWLFATEYFDEEKPMHKIPFTAQFCCAVEEIDYEALCEVVENMTTQVQKLEQPESVEFFEESPHLNYMEAQRLNGAFSAVFNGAH